MIVKGYRIKVRANLKYANLRDADLRDADLRASDLRYACLIGANLSGADLRGATLHGASMQNAKLTGAKLPYFQICPEEGGFYAWKQVRGGNVIKLYIPADAKRTSTLVGRKCRASYARVVEGCGESLYPSYNIDGHIIAYKQGEYVYPDSYDDDIRVECTHGIHFFMTKKEAEEY